MTGAGATPSDASDGNQGPVNLDDPLSLHANDISCITVVSIKLRGTDNYQNWAMATERALTIRNKIDFINGKCSRPTEDEKKSVKWDRANVVVVSWILASMIDSISSALILSQNAKDLWAEL